MVVSKRKKQIRDTFIKQVGKFKYLGSALIEVGKRHTEIRNLGEIKKMLKLSKVLRHC